MFSCLLQLPFLLRMNLTAKTTNSIAKICNNILLEAHKRRRPQGAYKLLTSCRTEGIILGMIIPNHYYQVTAKFLTDVHDCYYTVPLTV